MAFRHRAGRGLALMTGIAYGAAMMYLLDPDMGRQRRHQMRQELTQARDQVRSWLQELRDRLSRVPASLSEWRARLRETQVPDDILERHVRAQVDHVVENAALLAITCHQGGVMVRGPLLAGEREKIQQRLGRTRGVRYWSMEVREVEPPVRSA